MHQYDTFRRKMREYVLTKSSAEIEEELQNVFTNFRITQADQAFDFGVSGTNACEAFNRVIKSYGANFASHALSIMQITDFIFETYTAKFKSIIERKTQLVNVANMSQFEKDLKCKLGAYAENKLMKQMCKAMFLNVVANSDNTDFTVSSPDAVLANVTLTTSNEICSFQCTCGYLQRKGIICSHIVAVKQILGLYSPLAFTRCRAKSN
ncbi:hypothetical protein O9G_001814 [Rozella allomycis CSF55]|uniref:SWIM-type domain-containing protein n=1 Tax=Rozella allomycis (strain CSF55) TaxID=988480 RepID=A0A075AW78_ROZAC|nr:hypothetical protein O9G_001814 [Rozella allomycis CSF55]|eukprot:EPZ34558.1 hypothetical protein O9G_001814 [Rozella allomycis CSF55]